MKKELIVPPVSLRHEKYREESNLESEAGGKFPPPPSIVELRNRLMVGGEEERELLRQFGWISG